MNIAAPLNPPPPDAFLAWVIAHPRDVAAYLRTIYALSNGSVAIVINGQTVRTPFVFAGENCVASLSLPNRLPAAIANATNASDVIVQFNALLAALRTTGQLPTA